IKLTYLSLSAHPARSTRRRDLCLRPERSAFALARSIWSHPITLNSLTRGGMDSRVRRFLCADCDSQFSPWEKYTAALLVNDGAYDQFQQAKPGEDFYTIQIYDYASLKLCLLSILWKMSISDRDSY